MKFIDTLREHGNPILGFPSDSVLEKLYKLNPNLDQEITDVLTTEFKSVKPPLAHIETAKSTYVPDPPKYVPYIQCMIANRYSKTFSIAELKTLMESLGYHISSKGQLSNIWNRAETKLKLKDKNRTAVKDSKERVKEAKKQGKSKLVTFTEGHQKQLAAARKVKAEKDLLAKLEKERKLAKKRLANAAKKKGMTVKEMQQPDNSLKEEIKETGKKVLYEPTTKQAEFHAAGEDIVLYGGAAGGGKSYAMLIDVLRYCMYEDYRGLIIRRTSPMLKELIGVSRSLYPKAFPGAKYNKSENVWYFPSGATIQFGYLDKPEDLDNYQGLPYAYIGFDEVQHQRSDEGFTYLMSRLRSANPNIKCYIRASANPGGAPWVKEKFIDPAEPNTTFFKNGISYRFIPASLSDNPYLDTAVEGEELSPYRKMLMALPEVKRKQLLEGDWLAGEDSMFAFVPGVHTTDELPPLHWSVINALDYGYKDPAAALWGAVCPTTGKIIIYSELECLQQDHVTWGNSVLAHEGYIPQGVDRVIDHTVFNQTGHTGPGVREQLARIGIQPRPADRNRMAGWNQIHQRLMLDPHTNEPNLLIHSSCVKLIDQLLSVKQHDKKPDDIDDSRITTKGRKHHWDLLDALRYLLMARPQRSTLNERAMQHKTEAQGFQRYRGYFQ